ncbi:MAG: DUF4143 domain-containing protein [Parachlamydiaceae bacterium]|nr:DUF4143 domain-containing protein [Parachlamydiaceae bacterium]
MEAFVGQEILAYSLPIAKSHLYYWHRESRGSQAEVDYLFQRGSDIIPIEVKSGSGTPLKSLHLFLQEHPRTPHGVRISTHNYSHHEQIHSLPLYATLLWHLSNKKKLCIGSVNLNQTIACATPPFSVF